ncbi:MAG: DUF4395 domain-containing protein [Xanthomonadales bacterium]|nr:DUF4395 domain-containing protein [Xanthomonadales bacterium]
MNKVCPISYVQVNERVAQLNAVLVIITMLVFVFTPFKLMIAILAFDFILRGFINPAYSLYSAISKTIVRSLKIKPLMVNADPKVFAAKIGFLFSSSIAITYFLGYQGISLVLVSILVLFAALEAIFRFCLACKIYPYIYRIKKQQE